VPNIKIIAVPSGEAPLEVREQWVGLVLPVDPSYEALGRIGFIGVLGGPPDQENMGGYPVKTQEAIRLLEEKSPEAARWWRSLPHLNFLDYLVFGRKFCELVP